MINKGIRNTVLPMLLMSELQLLFVDEVELSCYNLARSSHDH